MKRIFIILVISFLCHAAGIAQSLPRSTAKLQKLYNKNPDKCIKHAKKLLRKNINKELAYYFLSISYHNNYSDNQKKPSLNASIRYLDKFYKNSRDPGAIQDPFIIAGIKNSIEKQVEIGVKRKKYRGALIYAKKYSHLFGIALEQQARIEEELAKTQVKTAYVTLKKTSRPEKLKRYSINDSKLIADASNVLGTRYRYGGASKSGFDCSGFNVYVYRQSGITLPRRAQLQSSLGEYVSRKNCRKGDLIFFGYRRVKSVTITHTGIVYSNINGKIKIIHCPNSGVCIEGEGDISWDMYWEKRFLFIKRISDNNLLTIKTP